ncbi:MULTISPECIES: hypothetical protein [Dermacoccus]|uniref:hypothetical protein n=1 Tax=Dermacoccus TaxID=57495 RepID=UPI001F48D33E|nr:MULTISPECIES: hypothetical protein [Dermacoccus]
MPRLHIAQNDRADAVISERLFGLLVGMLLDQQIAMEVAFLRPRQDLRPVRHARSDEDRRDRTG